MQTSAIKPLAGVRILVTRPREQAESLSQKLRELGAIPVEIPTIEFVPLMDTGRLDNALRKLSEYEWVIFTSVHGVRIVLERMKTLKIGAEVFGTVKVAAVGPATAAELEKLGKSPDHVPREYLTENIAKGLGDVINARVLLLRVDVASEKLPTELRRRGALVDEVTAYRTVLPAEVKDSQVRSVFEKGVDLVTFTSPSTVRNLAQIIGTKELKRYLQTCKIACIGPVTVEAANELGVRVDIVAKTHTIDDLVKGIVSEIRNN